MRSCLLYTLDGIFEPFINNGRSVVTIKARNHSINVYAPLCEHKFSQEPNPTFYAC